MPGGEVDRLRALEESLWRAETRFDRGFMERILSPTFVEYGRSGRRYRRNQVIEAPATEIHVRLPLADLAVRLVATDVALVTYRSLVEEGGDGSARRSSLWVRTAGGWVLEFHQGTPIGAEAKD